MTRTRRHRLQFRLEGLLLASAAAFGLPAGAAIGQVAAPQVYVEACLNAVSTCVAGASEQILDFGTATGGAYASASASGLPGVAVQAMSRAYPVPGASYGAGADVRYYVGVSGAAGTDVPIDIAFKQSATAGAQGTAQASIYAGWTTLLIFNWGSIPTTANASFKDTSSAGVVTSLCSNVACATPPSSLTANVEANTAVYLDLNVATSGGASAYMDPLITVDRTWALANPDLAGQVSFQFAPGTQNGYGAFAAGAPEPGAWAMLLLGAFGVGAAARATRRRPASRRPSPGEVSA